VVAIIEIPTLGVSCRDFLSITGVYTVLHLRSGHGIAMRHYLYYIAKGRLVFDLLRDGMRLIMKAAFDYTDSTSLAALEEAQGHQKGSARLPGLQQADTLYECINIMGFSGLSQSMAGPPH
jgi:hypothetical protein